MISMVDIVQAQKRIGEFLVKTPCVYSPVLSDMTGAQVFLKLDNMQRTGSFKERGALNFLLCERPEKILKVVAASAGNHAQAVAFHAQRLQISATIFMPKGTPYVKVVATERYGATVCLVGKNYDEAFLAAKEYAERENAVYVHAYNDPLIIAGQGTLGPEIVSQMGTPDVVYVPIGGGGLAAGLSVYFEGLKSKTELVGVEARDCQSMATAIQKGKPVLLKKAQSIAEGILVREVGTLTYPICAERMSHWSFVSDEQIAQAIVFLLERQKVLAEGAGAAPVASLLSKEQQAFVQGKKVAVIISGGNIDLRLLARVTERGLVESGRLSRLEIMIKDTPGALASLLYHIGQTSANLVEVHHERAFAEMHWNEVLVELILETKGREHERQLLHILSKKGYHVTPKDGLQQSSNG